MNALKYYLWLALLLVAVFCNDFDLRAQQIRIDRIEMLPDIPAPYLMRDWKEVALNYDAFVYDFSKTGDHLPLIRWGGAGVNYPDEQTFGLHTVVGTTAPGSSEAINVLPSIIGATLAGLDKSDQDGIDWVRKSREFFNRRPEENVYLNHPAAASGSDWWYDTMPNVFFYQLYDLYRNTDAYPEQLVSVADQWLAAVRKMGGGMTPWARPNMNYRGWYLASMMPNGSGVRQPEAAGAIAWLLYHAYNETGEDKYRIGAEWAMEFLNARPSNPSYELQLPYGVYTAARMNAELGTDYDTERLMNWCFDVGSLRNWGMITGNWGGYSVGGLIGEVNGFNDYAFLMNTVQHMAALVPMVRYDDRFARAVGKWALHAAQAARLFYPAHLPSDHQDNFSWSGNYDPGSVIGYEALRQSKSGRSPYATGDAIDGGWGQTNLALYGSSHAGYLAGIVDTTDVPMILKLDLRATDFFSSGAYPTYLLYNPYEESKEVLIDIGSTSSDLYDMVSKEFAAVGVDGEVPLTVPSDEAIVIVVVPSGGVVTYEYDKMLVDGIVVDYRSGNQSGNYPPRIKALAADRFLVKTDGTAFIYCTAVDRDDEMIAYSWSAEPGSITGNGAQATFHAPATPGETRIVCLVDDGRGGTAADTIYVSIVTEIPVDPVIHRITASPRKIDIGTSSEIFCEAEDPEGNELTFAWIALHGIIEGVGNAVVWFAPDEPGNFLLTCIVENGTGGVAIDSILLPVRDSAASQSGELRAFYEFSGDASDASGNGHHGTVSGAIPVSDRNGVDQGAYSFDGVNDYIRIENSPLLNFTSGITVGMWLKIGQFFDREAHPISHGSWENRWKISITNGRFRWTVKTSEGIKDIDSELEAEPDTYYHLAATYDGADIEIYIDGELNTFGLFSGKLLQTSLDLMIGQVLPDNANYNFRGVIDELRIYDYALASDAVYELYSFGTSVDRGNPAGQPDVYLLHQNYPNPFNPVTTIRFGMPHPSSVRLIVYDLLGRNVAEILDADLTAGEHSVEWHADGLPSGIYFYTLVSGSFSSTRRLILIR